MLSKLLLDILITMAKYQTSITTHKDGKPHVYGYDLTKLAGNSSFASAIYLVLKGEKPDEKSEKMMDAILTISIDHGVEPASVVAARNIYSGGSPVQAAVAGGVLAFGEYHGGAIERAMEIFSENVGKDAKEIVSDFKGRGERISGFGHRLYSEDPRTKRLLELAGELGFDGKFVKLAKAIESELSSGEKKLPLNIDGIIAALLLEMGFSAKVGKGVFIIARVPGLVAHVVEEALNEKPVRRLEESEVEYTGPEPKDNDQ